MLIAKKVIAARSLPAGQKKTWPQLEAEIGISERTLRGYVKNYRESLERPEPEADIVSLTVHQRTQLEITNALETLRRVQDRVEREAENGDNSAARIGANKAVMEVQGRYLELLVDSGLIARNPAAYYRSSEIIEDCKRFLNRVFDVIGSRGDLDIIQALHQATQDLDATDPAEVTYRR